MRRCGQVGLLAIAVWIAATSPHDATAGSLSLAEAFQPYVKALTRDVYTYHYVTRDRLGLPREGPARVDDPRLPGYVRAKVDRYWDLSLPTHPDAMVSGLYVGTDPVATRAYGGTGAIWALVQVVLKSGFRFVDVRNEGWRVQHPVRRRLPADLSAQLEALGCATDSPSWLLTALESASCREQAVRILRELDVDGILYNFPNVPFTSCPARPDGAFIVVRPGTVRFDRLALFTRWTSGEDAGVPERLMIQDLFRRAREAGSRRFPLWPELPAARPEAVDGWMREHLFGCGDYPEDRLPVEASTADGDFRTARMLAEDGDLTRAIVFYRRVLQRDPEHVEASNDLAWLFATSPDPGLRNPPEAVRLASVAVEASHYKQRVSTTGANWPKTFKIRASHTMAVAYASAGDFALAAEYCRQALAAAEKLHRVTNDAESTQLVGDSRIFLALFESRRPYRRPPGSPALPHE